MNKLIIICVVFLGTMQCALLRSKSKEVIQPTDSKEILYDKIKEYRETNGNLFQQLNSEGTYTDGEANIIYGKAQGEVDFLLHNMDTFGQHLNFKANSDGLTQYCEIIAKIEHKTYTPYTYVYDLWIKDEEVKEDLLNEYTAIDADCQTRGIGWTCVLMLGHK